MQKYTIALLAVIAAILGYAAFSPGRQANPPLAQDGEASVNRGFSEIDAEWQKFLSRTPASEEVAMYTRFVESKDLLSSEGIRVCGYLGDKNSTRFAIAYRGPDRRAHVVGVVAPASQQKEFAAIHASLVARYNDLNAYTPAKKLAEALHSPDASVALYHGAPWHDFQDTFSVSVNGTTWFCDPDALKRHFPAEYALFRELFSKQHHGDTVPDYAVEPL